MAYPDTSASNAPLGDADHLQLWIQLSIDLTFPGSMDELGLVGWWSCSSVTLEFRAYSVIVPLLFPGIFHSSVADP